jgi:hypothetical protein
VSSAGVGWCGALRSCSSSLTILWKQTGRTIRVGLDERFTLCGARRGGVIKKEEKQKNGECRDVTKREN